MSKAKELLESLDPLIEADTDLDKVVKVVKGVKGLFDLEDALRKAGFKKVNTSVADPPMPAMVTVVSGKGKKIVIVNKKYVDKPDEVVGDLAIGFLD